MQLLLFCSNSNGARKLTTTKPSKKSNLYSHVHSRSGLNTVELTIADISVNRPPNIVLTMNIIIIMSGACSI